MFMSSYCSDQLESFKSSFGHGAYLVFITCVIQFVALSLSLSLVMYVHVVIFVNRETE